MIYPSDFESKIGFDGVRALLSDLCICELGRARVQSMAFADHYERIRRMLVQTHEMLTLINGGIELPTEHFYDVTPQLSEVRVEGSFLTATDLYRVRMSLEAIGRVRALFCKKDEEGEQLTPSLSALFADMALFPAIISAIDKVVNKYGEIADSASAELYDLRRRIASCNASLGAVMQRVISRGVAAGVLDKDTTPSMRDGRLVIPVTAAEKRSIPGIVHDQSATGKTTYIEPAEVVEASNRLRELREDEKREIHRILVALSDEIRPHAADMLRSYSLLGIYDFIRAKALFAHRFGAEMPVLEKGMEVEWYGAIHPMLALSLQTKGKSVVPLSLRLSRKQRILIISGPNAGGKSVTLKTAAIVQYMLQCGMLPTLHSNSHMCLFANIMIDIGDEQSLENDLSTYSSHLANMKKFMQVSSPRTLILVDEMGSGTEPQIGGALAQAILQYLGHEKVMGIVTTHYQNLKTFADNEEGFVNGAMLYDREKMQPLFRLAIGNPGSSFALEIARKTGLPTAVLERAREIVGAEYVNMDKYLLDIARDRKYWTEKRTSIKEKEKKLESLAQRLQTQIDDVKQRRTEILSEARHQASELLAGSNAQLERTIKEIRQSQADKEHTRQVRRELEAYKESLREDSQAEKPVKGLPEIPRKLASKAVKAQPKPKPTAKQVSVGGYVKLDGAGLTGKVLEIQGKQATVAFGAMRTRVELSRLQVASKPTETVATQKSSLTKTTIEENRQRQLSFKPEIDLRGMRADEALQAVGYFLDDAIQFSFSRVRILHGTGTGALRMAIRSYLQRHSDVVSFHDEDVRFGGAGITVVNL